MARETISKERGWSSQPTMPPLSSYKLKKRNGSRPSQGMVCWGQGLFTMVMNKNRSETRHKITDVSQDKTHRTPNWGKNLGVARKFTIIERLQGEEEDLTDALYNISHNFVTFSLTLITAHPLL